MTFVKIHLCFSHQESPCPAFDSVDVSSSHLVSHCFQLEQPTGACDSRDPQSQQKKCPPPQSIPWETGGLMAVL